MSRCSIELTTSDRSIVAYFYNSRHGRRLVTRDEMNEIYSYDLSINRRYAENVAEWFKREHPDQDVVEYREFYEYSIQIKIGEVGGCPKLVDELHKYFMDTFAAGEKEVFTSSSGMNYSQYHYDTNSVNLTTFNSSILTAKVRIPCSQKKLKLTKLYQILIDYGDIEI